MNLEQAIDALKKEYEKAKTLKIVRDHLAYALHRVWRQVNEGKR